MAVTFPRLKDKEVRGTKLVVTGLKKKEHSTDLELEQSTLPTLESLEKSQMLLK